LSSFSHTAQRKRQTDRWTEDSIMAIADHLQYDRLKTYTSPANDPTVFIR